MATTTWNLDATHTDVIFSAKHMMVTTVRGKFADRVGHHRARSGEPDGRVERHVHRRRPHP